jgi:aspartate/methionine/tyrosine aminotransferase
MRLPDFELERYFARWEFRVRHLLCASDVEGLALSELVAMMDGETLALWERLTLGYTEAAGHPLLRREIASLYDTVNEEQVLVHAGAQEAIFAFASVALGPGDHVVVLRPAYQSLYEVARGAGAAVESLPLELDPVAGWRLDLERLRRALRPDTRALVVNFPHNPTGYLPTEDEWREIVVLAAERGAWLLSDEVYRGLEHGDAAPLTPAADLYERAVSLGVLSKSFALAGLRIGWVTTHDAELLGRLAAYKDYLTICASAPSEVLAIGALRARHAVLERSRSIVRGNLGLLEAFFVRHAERFEWLPPQGGSTAFPRLRAGGPVERFVEDLLQREGVLLLPGTLFHHPGDHFRVGYGRRDLPAALERLEAFCAANPG